MVIFRCFLFGRTISNLLEYYDKLGREIFFKWRPLFSLFLFLTIIAIFLNLVVRRHEERVDNHSGRSNLSNCLIISVHYLLNIMFKKFDEKESVSGVQQLKSSVQKGIRNKILELYPDLEPHVDQILPKKENFRIVKCHDHIEILVPSSGEPLFFKQREGAWFPTLRLLHKYPFMLAHDQVDRGAIKFVLSGANIMCPGLTSAGGKMVDVDKNTIVAVMAEGKKHALAVGITALSTSEISKVNKGIGIETVHYLNDGLWTMKPVK